MKRLMAWIATCFALLVAPFAHALNWQDMWWNPNESGWGVNIAQQGQTLFASMYVYDESRRATWFVATLTSVGGSFSDYSGSMIRPTGDYYGGPFNPANTVNGAPVGQMRITFNTTATGTMTYNVGAVSVTKQITRFSFTPIPVTGSYLGTMQPLAASGSCAGKPFSQSRDVEITLAQSGSGITVQFYLRTGGTRTATCTLGSDGRWAQFGNTFNLQSSIACSGFPVVTLDLDNAELNDYGILGRYQQSDGSCTVAGTVGLARVQ